MYFSILRMRLSPLSKLTIRLSKLVSSYGELHQKRYFRKLRQSKGFRPQSRGFAPAFLTFWGCFECNPKGYFLIFINDEEPLHWMLLESAVWIV